MCPNPVTRGAISTMYQRLIVNGRGVCSLGEGGSMAEVPFAQQRVPVVGGLGFLTRRTIAILEDACKEVGFDQVNGVGQGSFCHGPSSCASYLST